MISWLFSIATGSSFRAYLARLNDSSKTDSLRHAVYMAVMAASIIWLSVDMAIKEAGGGHRGIDGNWVTAFGLLLTAVTTGKIMGSKGTGAGGGTQTQATGTQDAQDQTAGG